jgi:GNAT superfamily N-acetyltransferase
MSETATYPNGIVFETFNPERHSALIEPLTALLHEAYAPLAARGMKYLATHQAPSKTFERLQRGESTLGFLDGSLVSTVTLYREDPVSACRYYRTAGVFSFGQFAVKQSHQGRGIGSAIMDMVESRAKELGARELALDTSEHASELIRMYTKRGYTLVGHTQWELVNYRSVIMSKSLS